MNEPCQLCFKITIINLMMPFGIMNSLMSLLEINNNLSLKVRFNQSEANQVLCHLK
ncbi:unnamed protein product [Paramecium primaurelia]|uniref:Uncharacterized protein n=1 Tax=Paramecium primaurelia TaxID=5886 RepID=A0A8S1L6M4_PARPR|nr:unnamed protein product [Paramecium primaurelia]